MKHNGRKLFCIVGILFWATINLPLAASEDGVKNFAASHYLYYKDLTGLFRKHIESPNGPEYGKFSFDQELVKYSLGNDLRVVFNGKSLPYFVRLSTRSYESDKKKWVKVIYSKKERFGSVYVLDLGKLKPGQCYYEINLKGPEYYESGVYLQASHNAKNWTSLGSRNIFSYKGVKTQSIRLGCVREQYLRVSIDSDSTYKFINAFYTTPDSTLNYRAEINFADIKTVNDTDTQSMEYYIENEGRARINQLKLFFSESNYKRQYTIHKKDEYTKKYREVIFGDISARKGAAGEQKIDLPNSLSGAFKITIYYGDNDPLTMSNLEAYAAQEEVVFVLPRPENLPENGIDTFRLYYGNAYAAKPEYDINQSFDETLKILPIKTASHIENPEFGYSIVYPPVSTWIIRGIFYIGTLLLLLLSIKILRKYFEPTDK
ncbi:MAG: hypothetical protein ABUK01_05500 [Leptospirales bacterium]